MPTSIHTAQRSLFDDQDRAVGAATGYRQNEDDVKFERERKRASRKHFVGIPPAKGPCCFRCGNWESPKPKGEVNANGNETRLGLCRKLYVIVSTKYEFHVGDEFDAMGSRASSLYLETGPQFGHTPTCSLYEPVSGQEAA